MEVSIGRIGCRRATICSLSVAADGSFRRNNILVQDGNTVNIGELPAGTYTLSLTRSGFSTDQQTDLQVTAAQTDQTTTLGIFLKNLSETEIDLEGQTLDACELRAGQVNFVGADLSGAYLTGVFGAIDPESCREDCDTDSCLPLDCAHDECGAFDFEEANLSAVRFTGSHEGLNATLSGVNLCMQIFLALIWMGSNSLPQISQEQISLASKPNRLVRLQTDCQSHERQFARSEICTRLSGPKT